MPKVYVSLRPVFQHMHFIFFLIAGLFLFPQTAYAYLDPGTGSVLLSTVLAVFGAIVFSLKSLYYKILGKEMGYDFENDTETLLIFSEGKSYWGTFRPIVNELISRRIPFRYISLDLYDPALEISSDYMNARLFEKGPIAFSKLANIKAPVMLSTTPNIGCDDYPMQRSSGIGELVHVFHAVGDTSNYHLGALDHYNSVIMIGPHQEESLREIEVARNIPRKECIALGLPYLDDLYLQMDKNEKREQTDRKTVLVAPSWGSKGCFSEYGVDFVLELADAGFDVIVRLHPQSYEKEADKVVIWKEKLLSHPNISWNEDLFGNNAMSQSDVLVSDTSSIRFDYAFLYLKPVITLDIPKQNRNEFESRYQKEPWSERSSVILGAVLDRQSIGDLVSSVHSALDGKTSADLEHFRTQTISNFGGSCGPIVDYLMSKLPKNQGL